MRLHKSLQRHSKSSVQMVNEDMRLLQKMVTGSSVYKKSKTVYVRRPKHFKSIYSY